MPLLTSSWKCFWHLFFHCFFSYNVGKSCSPFIEILFPPMTDSSTKSSPNIYPSFQPFPIPKISLKTSLHFPMTFTICKHWSKFATCSPSHRDCGRVGRPLRHSYKVFQQRWIKRLSQNFDPWEGLGSLQIFLSFKRALERFISVREPSHNILG